MMNLKRAASYSLSSNQQIVSMQVMIVLSVSVAATGAAILESVFRRPGPVSGAGRRSSRIQCAASCAREKTCSGFVIRNDGVCEFKTDLSPPKTDRYQQVELRDVSSFLHHCYLLLIRSLRTFGMEILYNIHRSSMMKLKF